MQDIQWKMNWFKSKEFKYWKQLENRKKFIENFASKNGIKEPKDWMNVSHKHFVNSGGRTLLDHYRFSLFDLMKDTFPGLKKSR